MDEEEKAERRRVAKEEQIHMLEGLGGLLVTLGIAHGLWSAGRAWLTGDSMLASAGLVVLAWWFAGGIPLGIAREMRIKHRIRKETVHTIPGP